MLSISGHHELQALQSSFRNGIIQAEHMAVKGRQKGFHPSKYGLTWEQCGAMDRKTRPTRGR